ncbi:MAG: hypothetical protein H6600_07400 [Flavobacteriales bacterium]|nr:hypothetical protein [Flavobacteriales bacterium]MCB9198267.1 hypothetical protein [Flavobacteriales bacterium]
MKRLIPFGVAVLFISMTSCGGWTDKDKTKFIEACESKSPRPYCDCILDKAVNQFSTFEEFTADEEAMAEILSDAECLEMAEE